MEQWVCKTRGVGGVSSRSAHVDLTARSQPLIEKRQQKVAETTCRGRRDEGRRRRRCRGLRRTGREWMGEIGRMAEEMKRK